MTSARLTLAALLSLVLAPCLASAQGENSAQPGPDAQAVQSQAKPPKPASLPYELTVTVKESETGKVLVDKRYTLTVVTDDNLNSNEHLRDGDRIPYATDKGQDFTNIGTNVDVTRATQQGDKLILSMRVSNTSLLAKGASGSLPQEHDWIISIVAVLVPGKPAVVYSTTDAVTEHKVEIQATAQPLTLK
jgi:hypothetical protein